MLSPKDIAWLSHLSDSNQVKIIPFDPGAKKVFENQKKDLRAILGSDCKIVHKGATSLGISGKGDVDIYIPVSSEKFNETFVKLKQFLGKPGSFYPLERVRWNKQVDDFDIEVFLINNEHSSWKRSVVFEEYLKTHPEALEAYRKLKEDAEGVSTREYYRRKIEFMNLILDDAL